MKTFLISITIVLLGLATVFILSSIFEYEYKKSIQVEQKQKEQRYISAIHKPKPISKNKEEINSLNKTILDNSLEDQYGSGEFILDAIPTINTPVFTGDIDLSFVGDVAEDVIIEMVYGKNNIVNGFKLPAGMTYILEEQEDGTVNLTWQKNN